MTSAREQRSASDSGTTMANSNAETKEGAKANNGYATMMIPTLENITNKLSADQGQRNIFHGMIKCSQRDMGACMLVAVLSGLLFATLPEHFLHTTCSLFKWLSRFSLPTITIASVFYWASVTVQKYFDSAPSLLLIPVFFLTEICTQMLLYFTNSTNLMAYVTLLTLLTYSVVFLLPDFQNEGTYILTLLLMLLNACDRIVAGEQQTFLRCVFINVSACCGEALTRLTILQAANKPSEIEAKVPLASKNSMKVRRSSSTSSTGSNRRRTSLPALGFQAKSTVDATTLGEAHGMLSDLLADSNLPSNVASTLKMISTMIAQPTFSGGFSRPVNPMSPLVEKRFVPDETISSKICEQPDMRDDVNVHPRSRPVHFSMTSRRMSNLWTTTTSATGMPTVERESASAVPNNMVCNNVGTTPRSGSPTTLGNTSKHLGRVKSLPHNMPHFFDGTAKGLLQNEASRSPSPRRAPSITEANTGFTSIAQDKAEPCKLCGQTSSENSATSGDNTPSVSEMNPNVSEDEDSEDDDAMALPCMTFSGKPKPPVDEIVERAKNIEFDEELDKLYDKIDNWNFPIFDVWSHGNVLRGVAYKVFKKSGFFDKFRIQEQVFLNFFTALEAGYNDIPYHNSVHAADVLHGVYYFTTQQIAGFCPTDSGDCASDSDSMNDNQSEEKPECAVDHYDRLTSCYPDLERFALYSAAAMHDYDHPGRTNAFLVATLAPQALLYNDRSVLENHHAAQAFSLLLSDPRYNYVENLTTTDFKRFRFLVIEAVLATDLKRHFDVLQEFNSKMETGNGIDWSLESDRLLASQVCIKMADISGPSKQKDIHTRWTDRIVEEFYEQGEDEFTRKLPVSPYMERKNPLVAQLQETFINHLVAPLFRSYRNAGLMPGIWVTSSVEEDQTGSDGDSSTKDDESTEHSDSGVGNARNYPRKKPAGSKKKWRKRRKVSKAVQCEIMDNIENNYQMWVRRIKEQEIEKQSSSGGAKTKEGSAAAAAAAPTTPPVDELSEPESTPASGGEA